jgi:hypothetical protein
MRCLRTVTALLVLMGAASLPRAADASVSVELPLDTLAQRADAIGVFVPLDRHAFWEGGRIYTEWRLRVDEALAGTLERGDEVSLRTLGGVVGSVGQWVDGEPRLGMGERTLLFVQHTEHALMVVGRAQGEYRLPLDNSKRERLAPVDAGVLLAPRGGSVTQVPARAMLTGRALPEIAPAIVASWRRAHEG